MHTGGGRMVEESPKKNRKKQKKTVTPGQNKKIAKQQDEKETIKCTKWPHPASNGLWVEQGGRWQLRHVFWGATATTLGGQCEYQGYQKMENSNKNNKNRVDRRWGSSHRDPLYTSVVDVHGGNFTIFFIFRCTVRITTCGRVERARPSKTQETPPPPRKKNVKPHAQQFQQRDQLVYFSLNPLPSPRPLTKPHYFSTKPFLYLRSLLNQT